MKLSTRIIETRAAECERYASAIVPSSVMAEWGEAAGNLERDRCNAARSFYVACGVLGLFIAYVVWARHHQPLCGDNSPTPPAVVRSTEVYEL